MASGFVLKIVIDVGNNVESANQSQVEQLN